MPTIVNWQRIAQKGGIESHHALNGLYVCYAGNKLYKTCANKMVSDATMRMGLSEWIRCFEKTYFTRFLI